MGLQADSLGMDFRNISIKKKKSVVTGAAPRMMRMMRSATGAAPPGAAPPGSAAPVLGSMAPSFQSASSEEECEEECEEESDFDSAPFSLECATMSSKVRKTNECEQTKSMGSLNIPKSNIDKIVALTSLQTAAGFFKSDNIIEKIIGNKFEAFKKQSEGKKIDAKVWVTALIISYIEQSFPEEKDTWELIVEKARDWLGKTDVILMATQCLMIEV